MPNSRSYLNETFTIADPDARIRLADNLLAFATTAGGGFQSIPDGTRIKIDDTALLPAGNGDFSLFVHARDAATNAALGWTSAGNIAGKLIGHTVGEQAPPNNKKTGPNAAWAKGSYLGQIDLVFLVGTGADIKMIAASTVDAFLTMAAAARVAGRSVTVNSGFRTYAEQTGLYNQYKSNPAKYALAAAPGSSNHQNGIAFDIAVKPGEGNANYAWMKAHATGFGFLRTVSKEPWHWEYRPADAAAARAAGLFYKFPGGGPPKVP